MQAWKFFNEERYLHVALKAGGQYYRDFVAKGYTCGGPGEALYKLYRHTGDRAYLELLRDIAFFMPQCVSSPERPIYDLSTPPQALASGCICERVNTSDWESPRGIGAVFNLSCWCETSLLLSFSELIWAEEIMKELNQ